MLAAATDGCYSGGFGLVALMSVALFEASRKIAAPPSAMTPSRAWLSGTCLPNTNLMRGHRSFAAWLAPNSSISWLVRA